MASSWEDVVSDKRYQAFDDETKSQVRNDYFDSEIATQDKFKSFDADTQKLARNDFMAYAEKFVPAPAPAPASKSTNIKRGYDIGIENLQAMGYGALALAGKATGIESLKQKGVEGYRRNIAEAKALPRLDVEKVEDVNWKSFDSVTDFAMGQLGMLAPSIGESIVGAGIGAAMGGGVASAPGAVAGFVGRTGIKKLLRNQLAKKMKTKGFKELVKKEGREAATKQAIVSVGKKIGAGAAVVGVTGATEAGGMFGEDIETRGIDKANWMSALALGGVSGATELVSPGGRLAQSLVGDVGTVFLKKLADPTGKKLLKRLGIEVPKSMVGEAVQEVTQSVLSQTNKVLTDETGTVSMTDKEALSEYLNSAVAGALGGGVFGGVGAVRTPGYREQFDTDKVQEFLGSNPDPESVQALVSSQNTTPEARLSIVNSGIYEEHGVPRPITAGDDAMYTLNNIFPTTELLQPEGEKSTSDYTPFFGDEGQLRSDELMTQFEEGGVVDTGILGDTALGEETMRKLALNEQLTPAEEMYRDEYLKGKVEENKIKAATEKKTAEDAKKRREVLQHEGVDVDALDAEPEVITEEPTVEQASAEFMPVKSEVENKQLDEMNEVKAGGGIDIESAKLMFSPATIKEMSKVGLFVKEGGQGIDDVSAQLGYDSANDMAEAWSQAPLKKDVVSADLQEQQDQFDIAEDAQKKAEMLAPAEQQTPEDFKILSEGMESGQYQMTDEEIEGSNSLSLAQKTELLGINNPMAGAFKSKLTESLKGDEAQSSAIMSIVRAKAEASGMTTDQYLGHRGIDLETDSKLTDEHGKPLALGNKGAIVIGENKAIIHAFKTFDGTTAIHELSHAMMEDLNATDRQTVADWAGVKDGKFTVDAKEKFSRGFERYITEGVAPNEALEQVFAKLKAMMLSVYKTVSHPDIDIEISPEVRAVFDRMLGAEQDTVYLGEETGKSAPIESKRRTIETKQDGTEGTARDFQTERRDPTKHDTLTSQNKKLPSKTEKLISHVTDTYIKVRDIVSSITSNKENLVGLFDKHDVTSIVVTVDGKDFTVVKPVKGKPTIALNREGRKLRKEIRQKYKDSGLLKYDYDKGVTLNVQPSGIAEGQIDSSKTLEQAAIKHIELQKELGGAYYEQQAARKETKENVIPKLANSGMDQAWRDNDSRATLWVSRKKTGEEWGEGVKAEYDAVMSELMGDPLTARKPKEGELGSAGVSKLGAMRTTGKVASAKAEGELAESDVLRQAKLDKPTKPDVELKGEDTSKADTPSAQRNQVEPLTGRTLTTKKRELLKAGFYSQYEEDTEGSERGKRVVLASDVPTGRKRLPENIARKNFKEWFKGSLAVDKDGKPMLWFHGSPTFGKADDPKSWAFDQTRKGENVKHPFTGLGMTFTPHYEMAKTSARGGQVTGFNLQVRNPYVLTKDDIKTLSTYSKAEGHTAKSEAFLKRKMDLGGFDSVYDQRTGFMYVPRSTQSKELRNIGTYREDVGDVLMQEKQKEIRSESERFKKWGVTALNDALKYAKKTDELYPPDIGIRVHTDPTQVASEEDIAKYNLVSPMRLTVGDSVDTSSFVWDEESPSGEESDGVSVFNVDSDGDIDKALEFAYRLGSGSNQQVVVLAGESRGYGIDEMEMILADAKVLSIWEGRTDDVISGEFSETDSSILKQAKSKPYTAGQQAFSNKAGFDATHQTGETLKGKAKAFQQDTRPVKSKLKEIQIRVGNKLRQGMVDQFHSLRAILKDPKAHMLSQLTKSDTGVLMTIINVGRPIWDKSGAIDRVADSKSLKNILEPLGENTDRFLHWVVATRAEKQTLAGGKTLFTKEEIAEGKTLSNGYEKLFDTALTEIDEMGKAVVDIAIKTGIVSKAEAKQWAEESFYVPFHSMLADQVSGERGAPNIQSLTNQKAYLKTKNDGAHIGDPLTNVLMNWNHLISAGLRNQAGARALSVAEDMGIATKVPKDLKSKNAIYIREDGQEVWYEIDESVDGQLVLDSLMSLNHEGLNTPAMKGLRMFKRALTTGVTASPGFKIRNLIRDSFHAPAVSTASMNPWTNIMTGIKGAKSGTIERMEAGGGAFSQAGYVYGSDPNAVHQLVGVSRDTIINTPGKLKKLWRYYENFGNTLENINRVASFEKDLAAGKSLLEANFNARDQMDFARTGSFKSFRIIAQAVPFFNARLQGLDKLGRSAMDKNQQKQFAQFVGMYSLASVSLMLMMQGDSDYEEAEEWEKRTYHLFKVPGTDQMYRMPRPFEVGAIAYLTEQMTKTFLDENEDVKGLAGALVHTINDTLAMNPVPQAFKPLIELYSNKSMFTGRDIESAAMKRLSKKERFKPWTSKTAQGFSAGMSALLPESVTLSPIQTQHLVRAYTGWAGSQILATTDFMIKKMTGEVSPETKISEYKWNPLESLSRDKRTKSSKYITKFYDNMDVVNKEWADIQKYRESPSGKRMTRAQENRQVFRKDYSRASRQLSKLRKDEAAIYTAKSMSAPQKRRQIKIIRRQKNALAKQMVTMSGNAF